MSNTDPSTRDKVWNAALRLINEQYVVTTGDVIEAAELDDSQRRTARRTLHAMADLDWIRHREHTDRWGASDGLAELKTEGDDRIERLDEFREQRREAADMDVDEIISRL